MGVYAFPKAHRILERSDFQATYSRGRTYRRKLVHVFVAPRPDRALPTRLGLTASRKTSKRAVDRNRLRRWAREAFRLSAPEVAPGWDVVVNFTRAAVGDDVDYHALRKQLRSAWREAGVLAAGPVGEKPLATNEPEEARTSTKPAEPGLAARACAGVVRGYQVLVSPHLPAACRFSPTCSQYALDALRRKPLPSAVALILWRLARCQPFAQGGYDPVR